MSKPMSDELRELGELHGIIPEPVQPDIEALRLKFDNSEASYKWVSKDEEGVDYVRADAYRAQQARIAELEGSTMTDIQACPQCHNTEGHESNCPAKRVSDLAIAVFERDATITSLEEQIESLRPFVRHSCQYLNESCTCGVTALLAALEGN